MPELVGIVRNRAAAAFAVAVIAMAGVTTALPARAAVVYDTGFLLITDSEPNLEQQFRLIIEQDNLDLTFTLYNDMFYAGTPGEDTNSVISRLWLGSSFSSYFDFDPYTLTHSDPDNTWSAVIDPTKGPLSNMPGLNGYLGNDAYFLEFGATGSHRINDGIWQGEYLSIGFTLDSLVWNQAGMVSALQSGDLFVGIHVQAQQPDGTSNAYLTTFNNNVIPVPPAFGLGLMGFAMVGLTYIRKRLLFVGEQPGNRRR